jgi:zinc transporter, ZIP family
MAAAVGWGAVAASSLVIGALLGIRRQWPDRQIGVVLAFGAGALISAVSFELAEEGIEVGGAGGVGVGLALGAFTYFFASRALGRRGERSGHRAPSRPGAGTDGDGGGSALALGATLDGIPEQLVLGIGIATGAGVSVSLLLAIFISNLPEAIGSASEMHAGGRSSRTVIRLWLVVGGVCTLATVIGWALADVTGAAFTAAADGFAAGALLVMLIDSMIPEAAKRAGRVAGLVSVLGFAVAAGLSNLS